MAQDKYKYDFRGCNISVRAFDAVCLYSRLAKCLGVPKQMHGKSLSLRNNHKWSKEKPPSKLFRDVRSKCQFSMRFFPSENVFFINDGNNSYFADMRNKEILCSRMLIGDIDDYDSTTIEFRAYLRVQKDFPKYLVTLGFYYRNGLDSELFIIGHLPLFLQDDMDAHIDGLSPSKYNSEPQEYIDDFGEHAWQDMPFSYENTDRGFEYVYY